MKMNFSIFPLFSYIAYFATIQGVSVRAECVDSPLAAIFNVTCAQISGYGLGATQLSAFCTSQRLDQHCPELCKSCVSGCEDSDAIFAVNGEPTTCVSGCEDSDAIFEVNGEATTCVDVMQDISKCDILGVKETCKETCNFCPEPVNITALVSLVNELSELNNELSSKIDVLEDSQNELSELNHELSAEIDVLEDSNNELSSKFNILEDSQKRICEDVSVNNTYIEGYGCFPVTSRDSEEMIYIKNSVELGWEAHEQAADLCGGHLASIIDENEQAKVASVCGSTNIWIGGLQQQPCFEEPAGCWVWSDGNELGYTNWRPGQPNEYVASQDCTMMSSDETWYDDPCNNLFSGCYILPPTFDSNPNCNITIV